MKVVAILGTYRKGKFTDQIVDAVLSPIYEQGHEVEKIFLMDQHIEFCTNCRKCMNDDPSLRMGECVTKDDMKSILPVRIDGISLPPIVIFEDRA